MSKTGDYITQKTKIDEYNMNTSSSQLALSETGEKRDRIHTYHATTAPSRPLGKT